MRKQEEKKKWGVKEETLRMLRKVEANLKISLSEENERRGRLRMERAQAVA